MTETGIALEDAAASAYDSLGGSPEPATDTKSDTGSPEGHKPATDDADSHLRWLEANKDTIPAEKIAFLDKKFQPVFTRKMNLLQSDKDAFVSGKSSVEKGAQALLNNAGYQLPEGKSVNDLLYENDGRGFLDAIQGVVSKQMEPVTEQIQAARENQNINEMMTVAQAFDPRVKEHLPEVLRRIDADPELTNLALRSNYGPKALPYVMQGVTQQIIAEKLAIENADLRKQLGVKAVADRVGKASTKASGGGAKNSPPAKMTLEQIAKAKYDELTAE